MEVLQSVLSLIITLGILVTIHEYGHFWVARRCGVKVLRFSVGFGKPIFSWYDKKGTEFAIASIPLGGYVKMLDEREGDVPSDQLHLAFNRQSVSKRIAIVAAGPIANFLFAIFAYWLMFILGFTVIAPVIGDVDDQSIAANAGVVSQQEIVAVDGNATNSWQSVNLGLLNRLGDTGKVELSLKGANQDSPTTIVININEWLSDQEMPNPIGEIGIHPYRPQIPPLIGVVSEGGSASAAGVQPGDRIVAVNGNAVDDWMDFVAVVRASAGATLTVELLRETAVVTVDLVPQEKAIAEGQVVGFIGAGVQQPQWPDHMMREVHYGPIDALTAALDKTWGDTVMTLSSIKKMIEGLISVKNLSGPITIARIANSTIQSGLETFLSFLALLSVSLGVLNLLPIPVLDGGHLLYYFVELIRGKPLSEKTQLFGLKVGISLVVMLMFVAFYNDLLRL
ncbi:RIP metalloprotease RseP [Alkalimarinus alittae]|uniref:Zinc metalloprotease n=1 Tax=Alkalimarinus alittae TaxID=2961619 RepID=A0ABY6MZ23_9ALTE|nr:RIP metalloprotease RseP [Alkalimarinus alittae]UZE95083.1 RIP metalloprotease RseP [Alkalimarinus alittae]